MQSSSPLSSSPTPAASESRGMPPPPAFAMGYSAKGKGALKRPGANNNEMFLDLRAIDKETPAKKKNNPSPLVTPKVTRSPFASYSGCAETPSLILDFLYLGNVYDAQNADFLARNQILYIINVSTEQYWSVDKNIVVYPFPILDTVNIDIAPVFNPTRQIIDRVRKKYFLAKEKNASCTPRVLVHCQKGRSRSATVVLAYLIWRNCWSLAEALSYVRLRRPSIDPNFTFISALQTLQESVNNEERTRRFTQQSIIVRNLSPDIGIGVIKSFFERNVGPVREVVMRNHCVRTAAARSSEDTPTPGADESKCESVDVETKDSLSTLDEAGDNTSASLCIIFFACFENVKFAKLFASHQKKELSLLKAVPNKEIKLVVPSKLRTVANHSFEEENNS